LKKTIKKTYYLKQGSMWWRDYSIVAFMPSDLSPGYRTATVKSVAMLAPATGPTHKMGGGLLALPKSCVYNRDVSVAGLPDAARTQIRYSSQCAGFTLIVDFELKK
jgi:hypothetical protein